MTVIVSPAVAVSEDGENVMASIVIVRSPQQSVGESSDDDPQDIIQRPIKIKMRYCFISFLIIRVLVAEKQLTLYNQLYAIFVSRR